jgi:hypothetical protein
LVLKALQEPQDHRVALELLELVYKALQERRDLPERRDLKA